MTNAENHTKAETVIATNDGRNVNQHSNLCDRCARGAAQTAINVMAWEDDQAAMQYLRERLTRDQDECVEFCGRKEFAL